MNAPSTSTSSRFAAFAFAHASGGLFTNVKRWHVLGESTKTACDESKSMCNSDCTPPAEVSCLRMMTSERNWQTKKISTETKMPRFPTENEAFSERRREAPVGVEPTRDGFAIRCLSHLATEPNAGGNVVLCYERVKVFLLRLIRQIFDKQ